MNDAPAGQAKPLPPSVLADQKLCDAADFGDPRTLAIIRERFGLTPRLNARLWEFARAYDLLEKHGALRPGSRGISFGSAKEVLLYAVANSCGHLTVTDLYDGASLWREAATDDPTTYVLTDPPFPIDPAKLTARRMDARRIEAPDAQFDFAYSISAFEHFGDDPDFLDHLREVRRVLKPGGIYVMTTEVALAAESAASRGNYAFSIDHLLQLFREAGLAALPLVDMRVDERGENEPRDVPGTLQMGFGGKYESILTLRELAGRISAAGCFVLRAGPPQETREVGRERSIAWAEQAVATRNRQRYLDWVRLNPFGLMPQQQSPACDLHADPAVPLPDRSRLFCTALVEFGEAEMEFRVVLVASPEVTSAGEVHLAVNEMPRGRHAAAKPIRVQALSFMGEPGAARHLRFTVRAKARHCYAVFALKISGHVSLATVDVLVRRMPPRAAA